MAGALLRHTAHNSGGSCRAACRPPGGSSGAGGQRETVGGGGAKAGTNCELSPTSSVSTTKLERKSVTLWGIGAEWCGGLGNPGLVWPLDERMCSGSGAGGDTADSGDQARSPSKSWPR